MKYFTIRELTHSDTAKKHKITNKPTTKEIENLNKLVENVLDPLRETYGKPIYVNSGFRCPELNKKVGGARNSYHLQGRAADITTRSRKDNLLLFEILKALPHKELINEKDGTWIHVAF